MKTFTYDTETYPFNRTGKATRDIIPRLVCLSYVDAEGNSGLLERERAVLKFADVLFGEEPSLLVGANLAFDLAVMLRALLEEGYNPEKTWRALFLAPKFDIQVAYRLADIGRGGMFQNGGYSLNDLTKRILGVDRSDLKSAHGLGPDVWRNRYNELEGVRAEDYPEVAAAYALDDAILTHEIYEAAKADPTLPNQGQVGLRTQYDYELHLSAAWGLMVDQPWTHRLYAFYEAQKERERERLVEFGLLNPDTGAKSRKALQALIEDAWRSLGQEPQRTAKGAIAADSQTFRALEDAGVEDERFVAWISYQRAEKFLSTYLEPILDAEWGPLVPRYNVLVDSGRTSSSGPNVQNFPSRIKQEEEEALRAAGLKASDPERVAQGLILGPDIRGCFVPRPGKCFVSADYSAIEMAGFAQVYRNLYGETGTLADAINAKMDLHLYVVCALKSLDYATAEEAYKSGDPEIKKWREDVAKIVNYGGLGGGSPATLVAFARQQGRKVPEHVMARAQQAWKEAFTEIEPYFRYVAQQENHQGWFYMQQHGPNRLTQGWRLRVCKGRKDKPAFPQAANTLFQGIVADGALWAIHKLYERMYLDESSALFGARHLLFVHDENVLEVSVEKAEAAAVELSEVMVEGMQAFLPDLLVEAEPKILYDRWSK